MSRGPATLGEMSSAISTLYERAVYGAIETHEDAFRQQTAMARTKRGNYICCEYCGTGWDNDSGCCLACGAPAADALRTYIEMMDKEYAAYASAPKLMAVSSDYAPYALCMSTDIGDSGTPGAVDWKVESTLATIESEAWFDKEGWYRTGPKPTDEPVQLFTKKPFIRVLREKLGWQ